MTWGIVAVLVAIVVLHFLWLCHFFPFVCLFWLFVKFDMLFFQYRASIHFNSLILQYCTTMQLCYFKKFNKMTSTQRWGGARYKVNSNWFRSVFNWVRMCAGKPYNLPWPPVWDSDPDKLDLWTLTNSKWDICYFVKNWPKYSVQCGHQKVIFNFRNVNCRWNAKQCFFAFFFDWA